MRVVSWVLLLALTACCPARPRAVDGLGTASTSATASAPPAPAPLATSAPPTVDPVVTKASALLELSAKVEPEVTPMLEAVAKAHQGEMVKLAFRLKTQASTERKIRKILTANPELTVTGVRIDDALRYTMRLADVPPGHYIEAAKAILVELEAKGHVVQYVKNYWPANDNYSGINSVLRHSSGLFWELQFHTTESIAAQKETRPQYEEIRKVDTALERQRELFDAMTKRWNVVPIPHGVLEQGALHPKDQVRERARP